MNALEDALKELKVESLSTEARHLYAAVVLLAGRVERLERQAGKPSTLAFQQEQG